MRKATSRLTLLKKVPTGINGFDEIAGGGLPAGRPTLVCGSAGCGKSLFGLEFLMRGAIEYGEPGVLMSFEESAEDIAQNVASLGFDINALAAEKKLVVDFVRVERGEIEEHGEYDLEGLFIRLAHAIDSVGARRVVLDTIEALFAGLSNQAILRSELRRLFAWLKERGMTTIITGERSGDKLTRQGLEEFISDCVIVLDHRVHGQISTRRLRVVKSRGMDHSNQVREFHITSKGVKLVGAYLGPAGVLTGSARLAQEAHEVAVAELSRKELERKELALIHRRKAMEAQIEALRAEFYAEEEEFRRSVATEKIRLGQVEIGREAMARSRHATARRARNNHR